MGRQNTELAFLKNYPYKGSLLISAPAGIAAYVKEHLSQKFAETDTSQNHFFGRNLHNTKFIDHKILSIQDDQLIAADGVMLNDDELKTKYRAQNLAEVYGKAWQKNGKNLFDEIEGEISLIAYNSSTATAQAFCSRSGTKAIYYYHTPDCFIACSDMFTLAKVLRLMQLPYTLNEFAAYCFLTYGHLVANLTLIKEVYRLEPGMLVEYTPSGVNTLPYGILTNHPQLAGTETELLSEYNKRFNHAVKAAYQKDVAYGYQHVAQLSGGLDSRMNLIAAFDMGYKKQTVLNFGIKNCWDTHIAKEISTKLSLGFKFVELDLDKYYDNIWEPLLFTNCQIYYSAALHTLYANKHIDFSNYGFMHTGQVGDAVLATSLFKKEEHEKPDINSVRRFSNRFYKTIEPELQKLLEKYQTKDVSNYNIIVNNFTISGNWIINHFTEIISPFQHKEVLFYTKRIPQVHKLHYKMYYNWMKQYHPISVGFRHQRTMRRTLPATPRLANSIRYRFDTFYIKHIAKHLKSEMLPDEGQLQQNEKLNRSFNNILAHYLPLLPSKALANDVELHYNEGNFKEKTFCVSLLAIYRLLFDPEGELKDW